MTNRFETTYVAATLAATLIASPCTQGQFMEPPFYGSQAVTSIFDHEFPVYANEDDPPYDAADRTTMMHSDGERIAATGNTYCVGYSGHSGIDYPLSYDYVIAAHDGTVSRAGWHDDADHTRWLGLHARVQTDDGDYQSIYGHMSVLFVREGDEVSAGDLIGISGTTGNSTGPHLHFEVQRRHTNGVFYVVNPYGWEGAEGDPWEAEDRPASEDLWLDEPAIFAFQGCTRPYATGSEIDEPEGLPPLTPTLTSIGSVVIDDADARFGTFANTWSVVTCAGPEECFGGSYHFTTRNEAFGFATWTPLPNELMAIEYDLYAFVPSANATAELAEYQITHEGELDYAGIDQAFFNGNENQPDWAYLGRRAFTGRGDERALVVNFGDPGDDIGADAVAFVPARPPDAVVDLGSGFDDAGPRPGDVGCSGTAANNEIYLGHCDDGSSITSGLRFPDVPIPPGASIERAHLVIRNDGDYTSGLRIGLYGERSAFAPDFQSSPPSDRVVTASRVLWRIFEGDVWSWAPDPKTRYSPDISPIVQEIVDIDGWSEGTSDLVVLLQPVGAVQAGVHRRFMAWERTGDGSTAARLLVWYSGGCASPPCPE